MLKAGVDAAGAEKLLADAEGSVHAALAAANQAR
jgi:hypothetical protein